MTRRRMTQIFPWLLSPAQVAAALLLLRQNGVGRHPLRHLPGKAGAAISLFETSCPMYNRETGFDMVYQENKVFNLKLAAATLDHLLIRPGETFSFWRLVRYADRDTPLPGGAWLR